MESTIADRHARAHTGRSVRETLRRLRDQYGGTLALVVAVLLVLTFALWPPSTEPAPALAPLQVERVFLDVDSDGDIDLLLRGEVILNEAPFDMSQTPAP